MGLFDDADSHILLMQFRLL